MPLVHAGSGAGEQPPLDAAHEQARKIHPRYAKGELVRVAVAGNLAEAELIKGVLLEQGIPSLIRRTAGFDVPDFLAAGPRDVLVPEAGAGEARSLLDEVEAKADPIDAGSEAAPRPAELRFGAWLLVALLAFGALAGLIVALVLR